MDHQPRAHDPRGTLDLIGNLEGTNKGSSDANYLSSYEPFFEPYRNQKFTLLEIGVLDGGSLRTWRTYFPQADIIGIDHNPRCKRFESAGITVEIGSQDDPEFLDNIIHTRRPTIVIDDGSHMAHHTITSFERIFPALQGGGIYIVEDAYMHYGLHAKTHAGPTKTSFHDYFMKLAIQKVSRAIDVDDDHGLGRYFFRHIDFIGFVCGSVIIQKKATPPDVESLIDIAEEIAEKSGLARHWNGVAGIILSAGGSLQRAEQASRNAIALDSDNADFFLRLGMILDRQNRIDDAIHAFHESLSKRGAYQTASRISAWHSIGVMFTKKNAHEKAAEAFLKMTELSSLNPDGFRSLSAALARCGRSSEAVQHARRAVELAEGSPKISEFKAHLEALLAS